MRPADINTVIIAFGGNRGNVRKHISDAITLMGNFGLVEKISQFFITKPEGFLNQPDFINGALIFKTILPPQKLLRELKNIEYKLGRRQSFRNAPREIDLDIIFYNNLVLNEEGLIIPHPLAHERAFVLLPLSCIVPDFKHPIVNKTVSQMLKDTCNKTAILY